MLDDWWSDGITRYHKYPARDAVHIFVLFLFLFLLHPYQYSTSTAPYLTLLGEFWLGASCGYGLYGVKKKKNS